MHAAGFLFSCAALCLAQTALAQRPGDQPFDPHWVFDPKAQCWAGDPDPQPGETIVWDGKCEGGRLSGQGTLTWYRNGQIEGRDSGIFRDGILSGRGTIIRVDGAMFEGNFPGRGTLTLPDGTTFDAVSISEPGGWSIEQAPPPAP